MAKKQKGRFKKPVNFSDDKRCILCGRTEKLAGFMLEGEGGVHICADCIKYANSIIDEYLGELNHIELENKLGNCPTPIEIKKYFDEYVIGQNDAKETLAVAIYNHFKRLHNSKVVDTQSGDIQLLKSNCIILGASGSGKTYLCQKAAELLDVPMVIVDSTTFTEAGYVGEDVESIISRLYQAADYDIKKTEWGIVVLDECFKGDTEVMTDHGFVKFEDLTNDDIILQWNDDATFTPVKSERIVYKDYNGDFLNIIKNNHCIHSSTPNHNRVLISRGKHLDKRIIVKKEAINSCSEHYLVPINGNYNGNGIQMSNEEIQFHVAFAADGCIKNNKYGYISFKKERKKERLDQILENLNIKYTYTYNSETSYHNYYFGDVSTMSFINKNGEKTLINDTFINMTLEQKNIFINELRYWDEFLNYGIENIKYDSLYFSTAKYKEAQFVQMMSHLCGYKCHIHERYKKSYDISYVCVITKVDHITQQHNKKEFEHYEGKVYCVTVPSHMIMIRQNGNIFITGNCDKLSRKSANPSITRDVNGEGVQQSILKLLEGSDIAVPPNGGRKHPDQPMIQINTKNILFIGLGAFEGIERNIAKRLNTKAVGFKTSYDNNSINEVDRNNLLQYVTHNDLKDYGMIPELLGRMPVLTYLDSLDKNALVKILVEPKNSIIKQYVKLFKIDGIKLMFDKEVYDLIAEKAAELKLGARGLRTITEAILKKAMFTLPSTNKRSFKVSLGYAKEQLAKSKLIKAQEALSKQTA